jgi:hypothetical protein
MDKAVLRLIDVFTILNDYKDMNFFDDLGNIHVKLHDEQTLFQISSSEILIPGLTIPDYFRNNPSPLSNWFVPLEQLKLFIKTLYENVSFFQFNHLGFYYEVDSFEGETSRLLNETERTQWYLYEEKSNYKEEKWLFMGDTTNWEDPMIEFALTQQRKDMWRKYQVPQIQIDINTKLDGFFIEKTAREVFENQVEPFHPIVNNGRPVMTKIWLGTAGGVNIFLDFGTDMRQPKWHRVRLLRKISD